VDKTNLLFWAPRFLALIYIGFLALFALDVFTPGQTIGYYALALFMHLIPNFVLTLLLYIAWKHEELGAILFVLAFLIMFVVFLDRSVILIQFLLFSPLLIISFLLYAHSRVLRR
jgi:hypothetical protein